MSSEMLGWRAEREGGRKGLILNLSNTFQGEVFLDLKLTFFSQDFTLRWK